MGVYVHVRERFFQILFHYRLIQDAKYSSLCSIVGPRCFISLNLKLLIYLSSLPAPLFPLVTIRLFSMSVSLFLFCKYFHLYLLFFDSMHKGCHTIFLLLCLTYFTQYDTLGPSMLLQWHYFIIFCSLVTFHFILFMGFSQQAYLSSLPFPPPVDHIWSELFTVTHPPEVALHGMAHSFIELGKPLCQDKAVIHEENYSQRMFKLPYIGARFTY